MSFGIIHDMRTRLNLKQILATSCPTCGVPRGRKCRLVDGTLRNEPHINRKVTAEERVDPRPTLAKTEGFSELALGLAASRRV
jgi:hypothetical protein